MSEKLEAGIGDNIPENERIEAQKKLLDLLSSRSEEGLAGLRRVIDFVSSQMKTSPDHFFEALDKALAQGASQDTAQGLYEALLPILVFQSENEDIMRNWRTSLTPVATPEEEQDARDSFFKNDKDAIRLSEMMVGEFNPALGVIEVHILPSLTLPPFQIIREFKKGMQTLARVVKNDERIQGVQATSWIVGSKPEMMQMAGFDIKEVMQDENGASVVDGMRGELHPVTTATMTRETLLERYGK